MARSNGNRKIFCSGSLLIEAMIVLMIVSVGIVGAATLSFSSTDAFIKTQSSLEALNEAVTDFETNNNLLSRQLTPCRVLQETSNKMLVKLVTDSGELKNLGNDCGKEAPFGDWSDPVFSQKLVLDSSVLLSGIDVLDNFAYISAHSGNLEDPDLYISEKETGVLVSQLDIGPGINSIDATEKTLFAAAHAAEKQLQIINISDPYDPVVIASSTLPTITGQFPQGRSIFYYDSKVYIGTKRTAGREFQIFDVSDPYNPVWLGSKEINHNVNAIHVKNGIAYLATSGNTKDLIVLDAHNTANILEIASLDLPGNEDGKSIYVLGNMLFLGRFKALTQDHHELQIINISDVTSGALSVLGSLYIHANIVSIKVAGDIAVLGTDALQKQIQIVDVSSSSAPLVLKTFDSQEIVTGVDYESNSFYFSGLKKAFSVHP